MKILTELSLAKKITYVTILGLLLGIGLFGFMAINAVNQATDTMLEDRLTTAKIMADYVDESLYRAMTELNSCASSLPSGDSGTSLEPAIKQLDSIYRSFSLSIHGYYLVNKNGYLIWSSLPLPSVANLDINTYPSITAVIEQNTVLVSGLVPAPVTGEPVILLGAPVNQGQDQEALLVSLDLAASSIGGFVRPIRLGETGYVELVDQAGMVITRTEPGPKLAPFERSDHSGRFADLIASGKPTQGLCHTCHISAQKVEAEDVLAFMPLSQAKWGVIIRQSEQEALAPIASLRTNLLFLGIGFITIVFLVVGLTVRDIVGRMRILTAASKRIAEGDLTSPVPAIRKDEIGTLGRALDNMRTKLKASYGELEQRTGELSSLLAVSNILTSLSDLSNLDAALGHALDKILDIMKAQAGTILLIDETGQILPYRVFRGNLDAANQEMFTHLDEILAGKAQNSGNVTVFKDIGGESNDINIQHSSEVHGFVSVPLKSGSKVIGIISLGFKETVNFVNGEIKLLEGIAGQVTTALENARLHREVQRKDEIRGELLSEIFSIQEEERKRIARELHDETSQSLASLTANLEAAATLVPENEEKAKILVRKAENIAVSILDGVHKLMYQLRPSLLDDMGLVSATRWLAENNLSAFGIKTMVKTSGIKKRLPANIETALFRVIQEAINNILRHSGAKKAEVRISINKEFIKVIIKDDGKGFDVQEAVNSTNRPRGLGLLGIMERVELLKGKVDIITAAGEGTRINVEIPINEEG